jgi:hypothetical protein
MTPTDQQAVRIYAAAREAFYEAARGVHLRGSPDELEHIATILLAAAGQAAFNESLKVLGEYQISILPNHELLAQR